ncbi:putative secreted protein [Corynebacterium renale]|nr:putative secreted protein [Corynebacterium renale]STC95512.1 putative secreted protein [Corynebacterium renale]
MLKSLDTMRTFGIACMIAAAATTLVACEPLDTARVPSTASVTVPEVETSISTVTTTVTPEASLHTQLLDGLPVKGRAPKTGYAREEFGQRWSDDVTVEFGHNGCDTRNDILRRDLQDTVIRPGTHGCLVESGVLQDPYSGQPINFVRGKKTSSAVQIDHVVALADAWQKGAQQLTPEERANFANDPLNLLAVDGPLNSQKGAGDAATWQPPNKDFRCRYAQIQVEVKAKYALWVTQAEHDALARELGRC